MTPNGGVWHPGIYDDLTVPHQPDRSHRLGFIARQHDASTTFTDAIALEALERVMPAALLQAAATEATVPTQRRRKLPSDVTLLLCIAMSLWTAQALDVVLHTLGHGRGRDAGRPRPHPPERRPRRGVDPRRHR